MKRSAKHNPANLDLVKAVPVDQRILTLRSQKGILDADLESDLKSRLDVHEAAIVEVLNNAS